jgi:hypothetical protein
MFLNQCSNPIGQVRRASGLASDGYNPATTDMAFWLIVIAVTLAVWWVERKSSPKATQAVVKSAVLSLRLAFEAVLFVKLLNTTILLIGSIITGTSGHIAFYLLEIAISVSIVVILVFDALRVRIKLNDLDAARFPPVSEIEEHSGQMQNASIPEDNAAL